jgi:ATP-dependent RNA helicase DDX23/PRP28
VNTVRESYRPTAHNGSSSDRRDASIPTGPRAARNGNSRHHHDDRRNNGYHPYERNSSDRRDNTSSSSGRTDRRAPVEAIEEKKRPMDPPSATLQDKETAAYRARYMGLAAPKTKKRRTNDKKFVFDWDEDADTSSNRASEKAIDVAFGRGHFGGFDHASNSRGGLDRHWTEKKLIEMTERDWRIFREDFSISTKGLTLFDSANL